MAIDFTLPPEATHARDRVRVFLTDQVAPAEERLHGERNPGVWRNTLRELREKAKAEGLWNPHLPKEWGGMGLGPRRDGLRLRRGGRTGIGPFVLNAQAPDEGNMHTLLHWATDDQKESYLRPLAEGRSRSCFAMTEPEVAGSDPTLIQTRAVKDGDDWVINGHKWFISGAKGARFAIVIAAPTPTPTRRRRATPPSSSTSPAHGFEIVRDIDTMAGEGNHCEIRSRGPARARDEHARRARPRPPASASTASARRVSPTACAGSATPRSPSRCSSTAR